MAFAAAAALPVYDVLIVPSAVELRELCEALAVRLKEMPLRIDARVASAGPQSFTDSRGVAGSRPAAVLILDARSEIRAADAAPGDAPLYKLERAYREALERCEGRLVAIFLSDRELRPDAESSSIGAFHARLRERHRMRTLAPSAGAERLSSSIAEAVRDLLCEELALTDPELLDRVFAEPEDASAALLALLSAPARAAVRAEREPGAKAEPERPAPHFPDALWADAEDEPSEPLRQPARTRALEQRREGLRAFALGEYSVAIQHFRNALDELPLDLPSGYWLARLLVAEGGVAAWTEGSRIAQRVARLAARAGRPEQAARAHITAARAESSLGHYERAEEQAREAVSRAQWLAAPWVEVACQCARRGALDSAYQAVREAFHRDPRTVLHLNREAAMREMPATLRAWKGSLRDELIAAVREALEAEQRVARILSEGKSPDSAAGANAPELQSLPLLDVVAAGREAADRAVQRLSAFAVRVRGAALELGLVDDPQAEGEFVPLRLSADADGGPRASLQVLNWLYSEGERVICGRPLLRYEQRDEEGRDTRTLAAPRTGTLVRIDVSAGPVPLADSPIGLLRAVPGLGVELNDRIENSRALETDLSLGARRSERELRSDWSRLALWGLPAGVVFAYAALAPDVFNAALPVGIGVVLAGPALRSLLRILRVVRRERSVRKQLVELRAAIAAADVELARVWDDFRLLADRFTRSVTAWEDFMPTDALFTPGSEWSGNARLPGRLVWMQAKDATGDDSLLLDERLFPPDFASQLPAVQPTARGSLYRVFGPRDGRLQAARWATYFHV